MALHTAPRATLADSSGVTADRGPSGLLEQALALLGGLFIACAIVTPLLRLAYPHELQPLEGALVEQARHGWLAYAHPSLHGTAFIYGPLHQWLLRLAGFAVGGYWPGRLLSLIGSTTAIVAIGALVRHETRDRTAALAAAGLYAASVRLTAGWFDLLRVDGIAMGLLFAALWRIRTATNARQAHFAAVLLLLACLARQNFVPLAIALILATAARDRAVARAAGATFAIGGLLAAVLLQIWSHGWVWYYTVTLPAQHPTIAAHRLGFWTDDLFAPMPFACAMTMVWLVLRWRAPNTARSTAWFWTVALGGLVLTAWSARIHAGGYFNVLLPAYGALAIGFGLAIGERRRFSNRALVATGIVVVAIMQLAMLGYDPRQLLPSSADRAAAQATIDAVRAIPGEVWVPGHPDAARRAGKVPFAHYVALADVLRAHDSATRRALRREIDKAVDDEQFAAIIVTAPEELIVMPTDFRAHYQRVKPLPEGVAVWGEDPTTCPECGIWTPR